MLGNGNGKQRLVEDWSEDEATFVSVPGRQSGHTKVDIVKVSLMLFCETDKIFCWYNISDISSVWVYPVKYSARWVENVFFPTLNYKYILLQH